MSLNNFFIPLCLIFFLNLSGQTTKDTTIPKPIGSINDFEKIYTAEEIDTLGSLIADFEKRTTIQISIITIDTTMIKKEELDSWTLKVMNRWGVGRKDKNNGILIAISKGYRRIRIQNGYGIEKILSTQETKDIIDKDFIPFFKDTKYFEGTRNGLQALMKKLE
ncbi:MAG: TPM domain-containing protein [Chitinophagales bacterium]